MKWLFLVFSMVCLFCEIDSVSAEQDQPYQIGPGDVLNVYVWKEPELTRDITVMSDGRITYPLIGEIITQGLSVTELKDVMLEKLKKFIEAPEITVIVKESRSKRVYTIGKLLKPGPFLLEPDMTVVQALSTAGGFAEWADEKRIVVLRREGGREVQLRFNYREFVDGKNPEQNILLKPGDTIVVP